ATGPQEPGEVDTSLDLGEGGGRRVGNRGHVVQLCDAVEDGLGHGVSSWDAKHPPCRGAGGGVGRGAPLRGGGLLVRVRLEVRVRVDVRGGGFVARRGDGPAAGGGVVVAGGAPRCGGGGYWSGSDSMSGSESMSGVGGSSPAGGTGCQPRVASTRAVDSGTSTVPIAGWRTVTSLVMMPPGS